MPWLVRVNDYISAHFVDRERGGEWWGYLNRDGGRASDAKGGNYKGCFHVPRALLMCTQMVEKWLREVK